MYVMGVDIGTQSVRVNIYNEDMDLKASVSTPQYVDTLKPMWATQKASTWWSILKDNIPAAIAQAGLKGDDIGAIGVDAHMHGAVPVAADGSVVDDDVQLYSDKRGGLIAEELGANLTDDLYAASANAPIPSWHGVKIRWIKQNQPEVYDRTFKFQTPKDFINFKLTGNFCIDPTEAAGTFCMDSRTQTWSDDLISFVGIDKDKLPEIKNSYDIIGAVTAEAAAETGLSTKTKVICSGGDMLCMLYTSGMYNYGAYVDCTGTGGVICAYTRKPVMDKRVMNLRHVIEGWVPFGNIDCAGGAYRWMRDNVCKEEVKYAKSIGKDEYAYLNELASQTPAGADGLYFLPYLMGERTMGSADSRGCFIGLSLNKEVGHMVRSVLEGVAFEFKRTLDIFEASGGKAELVYHVGGAAKGDLWNQIKADIYNRPVAVLEVEEEAVFGTALMALTAVQGTGDFMQRSEAITKIRKIYEPSQANRGVYEDMYGTFDELHELMQGPFRKMADVARKHS